MEAGADYFSLLDTGITLEVRAGGPYIGFSPPSAQFDSDDSIFMAYVDTATAMATPETLPVTAVFAPFEVGPQILMWNPDVFNSGFEIYEGTLSASTLIGIWYLLTEVIPERKKILLPAPHEVIQETVFDAGVRAELLSGLITTAKGCPRPPSCLYRSRCWRFGHRRHCCRVLLWSR